jgi:pimeloyl-ACP methyl ester carboxylesterase
MKEFIYSKKNLYYKKNNFVSDRLTLVFVHGLSGSSAAWIPYEKKFEEKFNILTFDLRGHGRSGKHKEYQEYSIEKFADDLYELLLFLDISEFMLISHSFGALIALEFLVKHQTMAKAAVFLSPNIAVAKRKLVRFVNPLLSAVKIFDYLPFSPVSKAHVDYSKYINTGDWNLRRMIADVWMTSLRVYLYCTRQSYEFDREDFLDKIRIPTLIIHGKKDTIFPVENSIIMHKKIENSKLVLIEDADHIVVLNNFPEVSAAIVEFIADLASNKRGQVPFFR